MREWQAHPQSLPVLVRNGNMEKEGRWGRRRAEKEAGKQAQKEEVWGALNRELQQCRQHCELVGTNHEPAFKVKPAESQAAPHEGGTTEPQPARSHAEGLLRRSVNPAGIAYPTNTGAPSQGLSHRCQRSPIFETVHLNKVNTRKTH